METNSLIGVRNFRSSLVLACLSVRLYIRMFQHASHLTDFREILYCEHSRKSLEHFKIWSKSDKNVGHFTWRTECVNRGPRRMWSKKRENALLRFMAALSVLITSLRAIYVRQQYKWHSLLRFRSDSGYANAPRFYVIRTLPVLLFLLFVFRLCSSSTSWMQAWLS